MLKQRAGFLKKANIVTDAALVVSGFLAAFNWRVQFGGLRDLEEYTWVLLAAVPVWLFLLERYGFYASQRLNSSWFILKSLVKVSLLGGVLTSSVIYLAEPHGFSRSFFGAFLIITFFLLLIEQLLVRLGLRLLRLEGYNFRNLLIVGTGDSAGRILDLIDKNRAWGLKVVGLLHGGRQQGIRSAHGHPVLGSVQELLEVCKTNPVDEVIFCDSREESPFNLAEYIEQLDEMGITSRTVLNLYYRFEGRKEIGMLHDEVPLLTFRSVSMDADQLFFKRCLDVAGGLVGMTVSAVLFPFIALAIKLESDGPILFGQTRVRENGRTFTCWKFRSMYLDAEARKQGLMHLNEMQGAIFKMKNDPRVTRVGAFLRKTSLDELPQFWNVLVGEMSLVGTRPPTPAEVEGYKNWQRKRICMKPGITGLWQVSGRNSVTDFNEVVRLDLEYIDTWSLATDIRLLLRTLKVVFFREGAC
jgi:exopolysaccharide biosynthesis polyprenyl glycosylphosphotransferase